MSIKDLYDKSFIECIKSELNIDTDDSYNSPIVLEKMRQCDRLHYVYKEESHRELKQMSLFRALLGMFTECAALRNRIAKQIETYILYLRAVGDVPEEVIVALDKLHLEFLDKNTPSSVVLDELVTLTDLSCGSAEVKLSSFLYDLVRACGAKLTPEHAL